MGNHLSSGDQGELAAPTLKKTFSMELQSRGGGRLFSLCGLIQSRSSCTTWYLHIVSSSNKIFIKSPAVLKHPHINLEKVGTFFFLFFCLNLVLFSLSQISSNI